MGAWGSESCSNDMTWDWLEGDIHNMSQKDADASITNVWCRTFRGAPNIVKYYKEENETIKHGVVIWILNQGLQVPLPRLKEVHEIAMLRAKQKVLEEEGWRSNTERAKILSEEIQQLIAAIEAGGQGKEKHVKGLMEKIEDFIE